MTREEANRKLREWLGWQFDAETDTWHDPKCSVWKQGMPCIVDCGDEEDLPDFYADEAANAMLRDRANLRTEPTWCGFGEYRRNGWQATPMNEDGPDYRLTGHGLTAMEANCNAAMKLIEHSPGSPDVSPQGRKPKTEEQ